MFLVTDGTIGTETTAIVVDNRAELADAVEQMRRRVRERGDDPDTVTVNPVGPAIG